MAVTSVKILHNGWTGSDNAGSGITFNVVYLVEVDDKNDGPLVVINADGLPMVGDSYAVGNDVDPFAFVKSVNPSSVADLVWHVTINYGPLKPSETETKNGESTEGLDKEYKPTDNPFLIPPKISVSSVLAKRAAQRGAYFGKLRSFPDGQVEFKPEDISGGRPPVVPFTNPDDRGGIEDTTPITNSVFTPYDPPPEIDYTRTRVTITMNLRFCPFWMLWYVNSVNKKDVWFVDLFDESIVSAKAFCAKVMGVAYEERIMGGDVFWYTTVDILIDNLFSWRLDILDRGYCDTTNENVSEGATKKNIVDKNGLPLAEPVLLDGFGNQLDLEQLSAVYLRYGVYAEEDFSFGQFNIADPMRLQDRINF